jgi:hypothetical protein
MYIRWPYIYMEYTWHIPTTSIYLIGPGPGVPDGGDASNLKGKGRDGWNTRVLNH